MRRVFGPVLTKKFVMSIMLLTGGALALILAAPVTAQTNGSGVIPPYQGSGVIPPYQGSGAIPPRKTAPARPTNPMFFFRSFALAVSGAAYTVDNHATNTRTLHTSAG